MVPDAASMRVVPWYEEATAQVICDCEYADGAPVEISPRHVLKRVIGLYEAKGWKPVVAPELEFFLVSKNADPDYPLEPPIGRSGRPETGRQAYGIDAVNEFDPIFELVYDYCEKMELDIDTLSHESGAAQIEINFNHGDPVEWRTKCVLQRYGRAGALRTRRSPHLPWPPISTDLGACILKSNSSTPDPGRMFAEGRRGFSEIVSAFIAGAAG